METASSPVSLVPFSHTSPFSIPCSVICLSAVPSMPYLLGFARNCMMNIASLSSILPSQFASPHAVTPSPAAALYSASAREITPLSAAETDNDDAETAEAITVNAANAAASRLNVCFFIICLSFRGRSHIFLFTFIKKRYRMRISTQQCTCPSHVTFCVFLRYSDGVYPVCSLNCLAKCT